MAEDSGSVTMSGTPVLERGRPVTDAELRRKADWIRLQTVDLIAQAGLGHYASTFSCAEIVATLYYRTLRLRPGEPRWPDRDRFLLGKGHVATGLWPVLADLGFYDKVLLKQFGKVGSPLNDHPNMRLAPGIDFSSGSLGHGLSTTLGMTLAARVQGRPYRSYVILGDGELCEGQVWEAAMAAGHYRAGPLVAIVDRNQLSIDGPTESIMGVEPLDEKFRAFRWQVQRIDGHDFDAILDAFAGLHTDPHGPPQMIIADTVKGRGVQRMELDTNWHVGNLVGADYDDVLAEIEAGLQPVTAGRDGQAGGGNG